jgi:uncharacterized protein (DUF697 family)
MANVLAIQNSWNTIKEVDLRPLRESALRGIRIAIVGESQALCTALAGQLRRDPYHPTIEAQSPVLVTDLENAHKADPADLIILVIDASKANIEPERKLALDWSDREKKVFVLVDYSSIPDGETSIIPAQEGHNRQVLHGVVTDTNFLQEKFAPAIIQLMGDHLVPLGREFPLFRVPIARFMISDTCFSNAAFSLSTGLAELVPVINIPFVIADSVVLTKNQLYLVYKLGLALGFSLEWQDYIKEFGSVMGAGFFFRQVARSLIGLIPLWGIVPKVAISYAGTYVVGNVVLQWYLTGRHVTREQMGQLYQRAYMRGVEAAGRLRKKLPGKKPVTQAPQLAAPKAAHPARKSRKQVCPSCQRKNSSEAAFCQYCGHSLSQVVGTPQADNPGSANR